MDVQRLRAGDADRDHTLTIIQRAYEAGRLDLDEMRERQEKALKAVFTDELPALVADLPEGSDLMLQQDQMGPLPPHHEALPATAQGDGGFTVAIMSGRDILVEPGTRDVGCLAFWGGNNYDLTKAMGPGRIVTLTLNAIMGGCVVYVPPGVRVIDQSVAIMAGNDIHADAQGDGSNGTVVLKGLLFWGGNDVKLRK
ncbi:DUF1707 domain-containing protein [Tessaracoccus sp. ZS01]|uniref:DUF1707 SHOCT-like domain-containing protein n=1 Tax=Tessaracoccus sp. ZS01 TaxID=1906324 RepID=UPI00096FB494|nr:DUF1707 domain-containing protein [Tessaracoccus sp. ZS01]MCG6568276.1 DUF1707 domain-containing protein [Tessaracoccus sp. ZS01]OMG53367.1 hypothetical protein BJN44_11705 [Tessaracoccus sp. ZS01]